ncbi:hypothetical protein AB0M39_38580 [Streptomyces sp. NPDC051907]|uniref:hypothetical protein n=1 Tax=Streptomyces sp. NPDC051907 TaxID=3155284 RepID=UPI003424EFF4
MNAIVRLLSGGRRQFAVESQSELRLTLAHFGLETGRVWVAESEADVLEAAAVWLPPGACIDEGEYMALLRLHELRTPAGMLSAYHASRFQHENEHWTLAAVGTTASGGDEAAGAVLAPVLQLADAAGQPAFAGEPASLQAELLSQWGFVPYGSGQDSGLRRAPVPPGAAAA